MTDVLDAAPPASDGVIGAISATAPSGVDEISEFGYSQELDRVLSTWDIVIYGVVFAVPVAVVIVFGNVYQLANGMVSLAWLICAVGLMFTANSYGRLAAEFPLAGSAYNYVSRGTSHIIGSFTGWALMLDYMLIPAMLYIFSAVALKSIIPSIPAWTWVVVFVVTNTLINLRGIALTALVNKFLLGGQLLVIGYFAVAVIYGATTHKHGAQFTGYAFFSPSNFSVVALFSGVALAVLTFLGVDATTTLAEEAKAGRKAVGIGMAGSTLIMGCLFVLTTWLATLFIPLGTTFGHPETVMYDVAMAAGGPALKWTLAITAAIGLGFGCSLAAQQAVARLWFGMARDSVLPRPFKWVHSKYKTPWFGILVVASITLVLALAFQNGGELISTFINFGALATFSMVNITCIFYFAFKKRASLSFWWHVVCPLCGLFITGFALLKLPPEALYLGCGWLALGAAYFLYLKYVKKVNLTFSHM
jgi:amino acid transporter